MGPQTAAACAGGGSTPLVPVFNRNRYERSVFSTGFYEKPVLKVLAAVPRTQPVLMRSFSTGFSTTGTKGGAPKPPFLLVQLFNFPSNFSLTWTIKLIDITCLVCYKNNIVIYALKYKSNCIYFNDI